MSDLPDRVVTQVAVIIRRHLEKKADPPKGAGSKPPSPGKRRKVFSDVQE